MADETEYSPRIVILGKTSETTGQFHKNLLPTCRASSEHTDGFNVYRDVSFQENSTQMHELMPGRRVRRESSMDLDSSLDLTDPSLPWSSIHHPSQPVSVDSGPHALLGNIVTSSSSMTEPGSSQLHDIRCDIVNLPLDVGITDQALYYCLNRRTLIILMLDSKPLSSDMDNEYEEIFQKVNTVSHAHNTPYTIILAGTSNQKDEFRLVRQIYQNSPEYGNVALCGEDLIIDQSDALNKICDILRQKCSDMDEQRYMGPVCLRLFDDEESSSSHSRSCRTWCDIVKALKALSLILRHFKKSEQNVSSKVTTQIFRSALLGTELYDNRTKHISDLVNMGCLIPCYSVKGKAEKDSYNLLQESSFDLINSVMDCAKDLRHSPVLRIQLFKDDGIHINLSPLLISCIVSECIRSWDLARQGNKDLIFCNAVAFTAKNNEIRLNIKITNDYMYLTVFYFSQTSKMDKKPCQNLLAHIEKAIKKMYREQMRVDYSIRCTNTEGRLDGDSGWMEVDEMSQCDTEFYNCSAHDTPIPHKVLLVETLHYWFRDLNEQEVEQGSPDSSVTSRDLPGAALPEIAGCFGINWNLFFVSHGVCDEEIDRIKESPGKSQAHIHECLRLMKRMERWKGKLSFGSFRKLVTKYSSMFFNFDRYDSIVKKFNNQN